MASASKSFTAAPEAGSALAREREERKQIPQASKANNTASTILDQTLSISVEQQIRERAYELYLLRGSQDGHAEQDWLDAEYEILANR
jgi:hypothetical protein